MKNLGGVDWILEFGNFKVALGDSLTMLFFFFLTLHIYFDVKEKTGYLRISYSKLGEHFG